jgi:hypothetical protein
MARPKTRRPDIPRFDPGERVVWKSGTHWKMGTVLCFGKNKKQAEENLPEGYKIQYNSKIKELIEERNSEPKDHTSFIYFVAADTPLFKPGFVAHSVPERHLQKQKDSWFSKEQIMWEEHKEKDFFPLALEIARAIHNNAKNLPNEIKETFYKICPNLNK